MASTSTDNSLTETKINKNTLSISPSNPESNSKWIIRTVEYGRKKKMVFRVDPNSPFEEWPLLMQFEFILILQIFNQLHLIPDHILHKFQTFMELHDQDLLFLQDL